MDKAKYKVKKNLSNLQKRIFKTLTPFEQIHKYLESLFLFLLRATFFSKNFCSLSTSLMLLPVVFDPTLFDEGSSKCKPLFPKIIHKW